ncbi:hypothetical protein Esti_001988 [Eimeria stiedai]
MNGNLRLVEGADKQQQQQRRGHAPLSLFLLSKKMQVAVRFRGSRHLLQLSPAATIEELQQQVQRVTQLPPSLQQLRWGFPPQLIPTEGKQQKLQDLGCTNGHLILVEEADKTACSPAPSAPLQPPPPAVSPPAPNAQQQQQQQGAGGAHAPGWEAETLQAVSLAAAAASRAPRPPVSSAPPEGYRFVRVPVPADDSCLFASVSLVAVPSMSAQQLRDLAAAGILADPERFDEVVLELPSPLYVQRLRASSSWGGYLELAVLAEQLQQQLAVVDAETGRTDLYGEQFTERRSYLLYDGVHYDPLVALPAGWQGNAAAAAEAKEEEQPHILPLAAARASPVLTVFTPADAAAAAAAAAVGRAVQQQHAFVRASGMAARCLVCGEQLRNNKELRRHAQDTGHQNFAHIKQ